MHVQVELPERHSQIRLHNGSEKKFSDEAFAEFCRANPDLRIERNSRGEIIVMPPAGGESSNRNISLAAQLYNWADQDGRGQAFDSSAGFRLTDGSILSPAAAWAFDEALRRLTAKQKKGFLPLCPEFVVEVRSSTDSLAQAKQKMELWIANGAYLAWLIDGDARTVYVYRKNRLPKTHRGIKELAGEGPVQGFVLKFAAIWRGLA